MPMKFFIYCPNCGNHEKEIKFKDDINHYCPLCGEYLKGYKISTKRYEANYKRISVIGISMWVSFEKNLKRKMKIRKQRKRK